jgi:hypothetical protein
MIARSSVSPAWPVRSCIGLAVGAAIAAVDNIAFNGEVSPIVVIAMLLAATITAGFLRERLGLATAVAVWICVPGVHLTKRILGLPDTLHPNTFTSILMLAVFSLAVVAAGTGCGLLIRRLVLTKSDEILAD